MDQLIQMVKERANLDDEQATTAVNTVVGFLKDRLPDPIAGQIDGVISRSGSEAGSPMDQVGSILGR